MHSIKAWGLGAPLVAFTAALAFAGPASAASSPVQSLGCESAVAQVTSLLGAAPVIAPYVANPAVDPCTATSVADPAGGTVSLGSLTNLLGGGSLTLGPATVSTSGVSTATNMSATATAAVSNVSIPTPAGAVTIPGSAMASVSYSCAHGSLRPTVSSTLNSVSIGGQTFTLPSDGASETLPLDLPIVGTQIGTVTLNDNMVTATGDTLDLADVQIPGVADEVVGQTTVTRPVDDACTALTGINGTNGSNGGTGSNGGNGGNGAGGTNGTNGDGACPAGTVLLSNGDMCALVAGTNGRSIPVVQANSDDIVGGQVISLARARRRYHSACLKGGGPKYVVIGTKRANHITVAHKRMRVLGLGGNDIITVKGGSGTCVDGGAGSDRIVNLGRNRVRAYGGAGSDRFHIGSGAAFVSAGAGNNTVRAGAGRDVIVVGHGRNRVTARGPHVLVRAGHGKTVAYLKRSNIAYARRHGVRAVHVLAG